MLHKHIGCWEKAGKDVVSSCASGNFFWHSVSVRVLSGYRTLCVHPAALPLLMAVRRCLSVTRSHNLEKRLPKALFVDKRLFIIVMILSKLIPLTRSDCHRSKCQFIFPGYR